MGKSNIFKIKKEYGCVACKFETDNKFNYQKHILTEKHKNKLNPRENICGICGKIYKYKSGLSRHKQKCNNKGTIKVYNNNEVLNSGNNNQDNMIKAITDTLSKQGDLIEKLVNTQKEMIPKIGNNNNNKISINVFLNEHCKNAMNLTDFINNIKISLEDLEYTNAHGYVKGLSNIFTKNLTDMKATERPIHCSDKKRLQFYVKEEDKWDKDDKNIRIDKGIESIKGKAFTELKKWEAAHPDFDKINSPENVEWLMMIQKLSGGTTAHDRVKNTENIKKNMSNILGIREAIEN
tara:strand:+ start:2943 stop:3821 length:879 start_codon:yes stop_codon:yes gene_type:complete